MFFLHQRGKAFAIFEVLIIFAVVGGGTLGGFIAQTRPWADVFWWTLGPVGAAIICVFLFVEDTTYIRDPNAVQRTPVPKGWLANRVATFFPGTRTQPPGKGQEFVSLRLATHTSQSIRLTQFHRSADLSFRSRLPSHLSRSSSVPTFLLRWVYPSCKPRL